MMTSILVIRSVEVVVIMLYGELVYLWRVYSFPVARITTCMPNTGNEYTP